LFQRGNQCTPTAPTRLLDSTFIILARVEDVGASGGKSTAIMGAARLRVGKEPAARAVVKGVGAHQNPFVRCKKRPPVHVEKYHPQCV
jgi:hypothetical protein